MDAALYSALKLDRIRTEYSTRRINGRSNLEILGALDTPGDAHYHPCPEAFFSQDEGDGGSGRVERVRNWAGSAVFADTIRDVWVYVSPGGEGERDLPLLVFNDGAGYLDPNGPVRATRVLDALVATGELPPVAAVFVMPGRPPDIERPHRPGERPDPRANDQRSFEYDSLTDDYARFVIDELLPMAAALVDVRFTEDPAWRAMIGISSGGICAFNVAWHRPDQFGRVVSHCGSFVAIRGGHEYPVLIRHSERKPIRVFLQSGERDADILFGNWALANQTMAAALEFAGYEARFEFGTGGHNLRHGGALFADTLRWLFATNDGDDPQTGQE
ncbi:MAG: alpha/beta hydrolase-fold protein [Pseudomonadota bacterium]